MTLRSPGWAAERRVALRATRRAVQGTISRLAMDSFRSDPPVEDGNVKGAFQADPLPPPMCPLSP